MRIYTLKRNKEVIKLLRTGLTPKEIANKFFMSISNVYVIKHRMKKSELVRI